MPVKSLSRDGRVIEQARLTKLLAFRGLDRRPIEEARAGDIIAVAGLAETTVADTICAPEVTAPLPADPIDPPTLAMTFSVNDSPLAGPRGHQGHLADDRRAAVSRGRGQCRDPGHARATQKDAFEVAGRGELQLGVLIETMRREGFELSISRPRVLFKTDPATGQRLEPIEEVMVDVDEEFAGIVVDKMSRRKAEMQEMRPSGGGKLRLSFLGADARPDRLSGRVSDRYPRHRGDEPAVPRLRPVQGADRGTAQRRPDLDRQRRRRSPMRCGTSKIAGRCSSTPGTQVYQGMIIGAHTRGNDLDVNPIKGKQLTNIRTTSKDEAVRLTPPQIMSLEQAIAYIADDELVEVTPKSIRLRKRLLDPNDRKRASRAAAAAE